MLEIKNKLENTALKFDEKLTSYVTNSMLKNVYKKFNEYATVKRVQDLEQDTMPMLMKCKEKLEGF